MFGAKEQVLQGGGSYKEADSSNETMTNATMTPLLTPAVMPARHLNPVAIF
jgi:hypothetical protein